MLVYQTETFRQQVLGTRDGDVQARVEALIGKIRSATGRWEADQHWQNRDRGYLKQRIGSWRLLGRFVDVEGETVCCMIAFFGRGSDEYEKAFLRDKDFDLVDRGYSDHEMLDWFHQQARTTDRVKAEELPIDLRKWLDVPVELAPDAPGSDVVIYEEESWTLEAAESRISNRYSPLCDFLLQIVGEPFQEELAGWTVRATAGEDLCVVVARPTPAVVLLAHVTTRRSEAAELAGRRGDVPKDFGRRARRAYPAFLLADFDLWSQIQSGETSNLSLSPEEHELLQKMGSVTEDGHGLPMFINGRAGSGKSTMLMYAFAGLYRRRLQHNLESTPIFLTYGGRLREKARIGVEKLLATNHQFLVDHFDPDHLRSCFVEFRDFLLDMLPPDERQRFSDDRRVLYHDFRSAYEGNTGRLRRFMAARPRGVPAELAWFVIRSLIKGAAGSERELDIDGFRELDRKDRVVTEQIFETVREQVYEAWYRPQMEEHELWDDQDLVRAALELGRVSGRSIAGVVCDEAQDFTRRELRLLIRSCALTQFELPAELRSVRLPFVLAGDPLQAISPTGFRWEQFTSAMYEEVTVIAGANAGKPCFEELKLNYRSTAEIVLVTNAIQQLRVKWLRLTGVHPQQPWGDRGGAELPRRFVIGAGITADQFEDLTKDAVIVVPCEESGEAEYVRQDPVLSQIYRGKGEIDTPYNVFSSSAAKGLEFPRVVVYGFGAALPPLPKGLEDLDADDDALFQLKHFFNKLYVAVTRAEKSLYIVDSPDGDANFWKELGPAEVARRSIGTAFANLAEGLVPGTAEDFKSLGAANPLENAEKLAQSGRDSRVATQLRQAAGYYNRAGRPELARRCDAEAMEIEGRFFEAAGSFRAIGDLLAAWRCYWACAAWQELVGLQGLAPTLIPQDEARAAIFMDSNDPALELVLEVSKLTLHRIRTTATPESARQWHVVAEHVALKSHPTGNTDLVRAIAMSLVELAELGIRGAGERAGSLFYALEAWSDATRLWDKFGCTFVTEYALASAYSEGFPDGLGRLQAAGLSVEIVRQWERAGRPSGASWLEYVAPSLASTPQGRPAAAKAYLALNLIEEAISNLDPLSRQSSGEDREVWSSVAERVGREGDPGQMRALINGRNFQGVDREKDRSAVIKQLLEAFVRHRLNVAYWTRRDSDKQLSEFLDSIVRNQTGVHPLVLGAAYEYSGAIVKSLQYYERLTTDNQKDVRDAARRRWLRVKDRQIEVAGSVIDKNKSSQERERQAKEWGVAASTSIDSNPQLSHLFGTQLVSGDEPDPTPKANFALRGELPPLRWDVRDGRLDLVWDDGDNFQAVLVDRGQRKVRGTDPELTESGLEFRLVGCRCSLDFEFGSLTIVVDDGRVISGTL